jgi:hypothetical protein
LPVFPISLVGSCTTQRGRNPSLPYKLEVLRKPATWWLLRLPSLRCGSWHRKNRQHDRIRRDRDDRNDAGRRLRSNIVEDSKAKDDALYFEAA